LLTNSIPEVPTMSTDPDEVRRRTRERNDRTFDEGDVDHVALA
jgi:hypothetical protein